MVGLDISDEMIRRARQRYVDVENAMFAAGEAEEIPWDGGFFTRVISVESAYYWPDPQRGLREIFRVLREGGSAWVLINYYSDNPHSHQWADILSIPATLRSGEEWARNVPRSGLRGRGLTSASPIPRRYPTIIPAAGSRMPRNCAPSARPAPCWCMAQSLYSKTNAGWFRACKLQQSARYPLNSLQSVVESFLEKKSVRIKRQSHFRIFQ